jgi:hypothetical protein
MIPLNIFHLNFFPLNFRYRELILKNNSDFSTFTKRSIYFTNLLTTFYSYFFTHKLSNIYFFTKQFFNYYGIIVNQSINNSFFYFFFI